ncbi:MAG: AraC family transcriptional regulator [Piscinibacter sp.]|nr:AraC family transcriptional regulator [Piscinibacter sp.]
MPESAPEVPEQVPDDPALAVPRARLVARLLRHTRAGELGIPAVLPEVMTMRLDGPERTLCGIYEPCVALVVQGSKRVDIGEQAYVYDPQRFFVTPLDLPAVATIFEATPERPFLSVALRIDMREVATLILEGVLPPPAAPAGERRAMATGRLDAPLLDAFDRLLALLDEPAHVRTLAPLVRREITYRLLAGEAGWRLRQIAAVDSQGHQVARAIEQLRARYGEALRIEELARLAHMSVSTFHHHFKALTGMSPLQYQKQLRLAEARRLMLTEHLDAATAAYRVGYESASQFSREYSRQFGAPPMRDIAEMRASA